MKYIDKLIWSRAELFDFFSTVDHPFYSTTFRVEMQLHGRRHSLFLRRAVYDGGEG